MFTQRRRWQRESRGEDPFVLDDVTADLRVADAMLQQVAVQRGVDLSVSLPSLPTDLPAERLRRAGLKLSRCVFELEVGGELDQDRAAECLRLCSQLCGKIARVTSYLREVNGALASDSMPNLLLIEITLRQLHPLLAPLGDPPTNSALHDVERLLAPLLESVDDAAREHMSELVRSGSAPSPFLVTSDVCDAE